MHCGFPWHGRDMKRLGWLAGVSCLVLLGCTERDPRERDPAVTKLQIELMTRVTADQAIRDTVFSKGIALDPMTISRMEQVDRDNTSWLKDQIRQHGWPSAAKVGKAASDAALLIVQHAVHDRPFQRMALDTVTRLFENGDVEGQAFALLYDRVKTQAGEKQRYGTQAKMNNRKITFDPMEDSTRVDSLRATVGLPPLAVYRRTLDSVYLGNTKPEPERQPARQKRARR
jgi:hypothetical protein